MKVQNGTQGVTAINLNKLRNSSANRIKTLSQVILADHRRVTRSRSEFLEALPMQQFPNSRNWLPAHHLPFEALPIIFKWLLDQLLSAP
jgi:hypothetical protein